MIRHGFGIRPAVVNRDDPAVGQQKIGRG